MGIHDQRNVERIYTPEKTPEPNRKRIPKYSPLIEKTLEPPRSKQRKQLRENFTVMNEYNDYFEVPMDEPLYSQPYSQPSIKENFDIVKVANDAGDWIDNNIFEPTENFMNTADPNKFFKDIEKSFVKFGDMIKDAAEDTKDTFTDFGKDLKKDFTDFGNFWEDSFNTVAETMKDTANSVGDSLTDGFASVDDFFTEGIPKAFENAFEPVVNFFTTDLPDVFTEKIPKAFDPVMKTFTETIPGAFDPVKDFFQTDLPNTFTGIFEDVDKVFTETIPTIFSSEGTVGKFFVKTLPETLEDVFVNQIGAPLQKFFTETLPETLSTFFVENIGGNVKTFFVDFLGPKLEEFFVGTIGGNVSTFFTKTVLPELTNVFTNLIPGFFSTIWGFLTKNIDTKTVMTYVIVIALATMIIPPFISESIKKLFSKI